MTIKNTTVNEKNQAVVEFSFDAATVEAEKAKVFKKKSNSFNVPGFRRGKAPRSVIEKMYGTGIFLEDAVNELINASYPEIIAAVEKDVVSRPEFEISDMNENEVVLTATMDVKPEIKLGEYHGIEVDVVRTPVTDEEIDREIETVRERNAREIEVTDRAAAMGDTATIDYEGFVDGVAFDGGKDEGHKLKLGSGQFIPGFEEGVVGHSVGENFDVNVVFPAEYHAKDLAGKNATFKVALKALTLSELPELDDDFALDVSEFNTFAEYRADIAAKLEKGHDSRADEELEGKIRQKLAELVEAEIPASMIDAEVEAIVRNSSARMQMQGLDFKTYLKYFDMTLDGYKEQVRPSAVDSVKLELALEKIASLESIEPTEDEIAKEYEDVAKQYGVELDYAKENLPAEEIAHTLKNRRAVEIAKSSAKITYLDKAPEAAADAE